MEIRLLTGDDLPAAANLSEQAGWNQLETDWKRLLALCPDGCFGGWIGDTLVATSTVLSYADRLSWIGMVLVHQHHRRLGYGRRIFKRAVAHARERGTSLIALDATNMGLPLYRHHAFVEVAPVTRWGGTLPPPRSLERVHVFGQEDLPEVLALDESACGWPREALIRQLLSEPGVLGLVWKPDGQAIRGHALLRPGRGAWQLGPAITDDPCGLEALLAAAAAKIGPAKLIIDVLADRQPIRQVLTRSGLQPASRLVRMKFGTTETLPASEQAVAAAGLELG